METALAILGSSAITALIAGLLVYRRTQSEAGKIDAEAVLAKAAGVKTIAEARKVEVDGRLTEIEVANKVREIYGATIADLQSQLATQRGQFEAEIANLKKMRKDDRRESREDERALRDQHAKCVSDLAAITASEAHLHIRLREIESSIGDNVVTRLADKIAHLEQQIAGPGPITGRISGVTAFDDSEMLTKIKEIKDEVTTGNDRTLAQLADMTESRRIEDISPGDRTDAERAHLDDVGGTT